MTNRIVLDNVEDQQGMTADHWVEMRPMSGRDMICLASADENLDELIRRMGAAVIDHDFTRVDVDEKGEGITVKADILDQPWPTLRRLLPGWRRGAEDDAVPQS